MAEFIQRAEFVPRMCPIGLDEHPTICSAGYCDVCIGNRLKGLSEELTAATSEVERLKLEKRCTRPSP